MPKLEAELMQKYNLHYTDAKTVVLEERQKLGLTRQSATTKQLLEVCEERCAALAHNSSHTSFSSFGMSDEFALDSGDATEMSGRRGD